MTSCTVMCGRSLLFRSRPVELPVPCIKSPLLIINFQGVLATLISSWIAATLVGSSEVMTIVSTFGSKSLIFSANSIKEGGMYLLQLYSPCEEPLTEWPRQWSDPRIGIAIAVFGSKSSGRDNAKFLLTTSCTHGWSFNKNRMPAWRPLHWWVNPMSPNRRSRISSS